MNQLQSKITFLQKKGQITLPVSMRMMFNLKPGSAVKVSVQENSIVLEPAQIIDQGETNEYLEILDEIAKKTNTTREKLLANHKRISLESAKRAHPDL